MKLAVVTAFPPSKVTLNEYAYHLVKSFSVNQSITEIVLLTDKTAKEKEISYLKDGCKITIVECWKFNSKANVKTVLSAINKTKPEAILFNLQFMKFGDNKIAAALGLTLPFLCKLKQIPTIVLLHNILEQTDLGRAGFTSNILLQKVYNFIGTCLTKLILQADTVAVTMKKYEITLHKKYKVSNITMIPHGTFEVFDTPTYELPEGPLKIMAFGKFGTYKKVESMIEAVEKVRKSSGINLEIVIAGTDNPNVIGYLDSVREKYKQVPQLTFTGYVKENQVAKIFNSSAVVVFPYTSTTGSSGVLHQAGSYGKAVVMPNLGDLTTLIKDEGYRGEFFDPTSVDSLATAIQKIVTNNNYRVQLGRANYKAATAYPMDKIACKYVKEFQRILCKKKGISSSFSGASMG